MNFLAGADSADRFNPRATSTSGSRNFGIRYPSPFFDVAQQFLPQDMHQLHGWCKYYFLTNPFINVAVTKMAEYPVTETLFETDDAKKRVLYEGLEEQLQLRKFQVEVGLDHWAYGSSLVSVYYPFVKYLQCPRCTNRYQASKSRGLYRWRDMKFELNCPRCRETVEAREVDVYVRSIRDVRMIRWNPENVEIRHNEITSQSRYFYKVPRVTINDVTMGDPDVIETMPCDFLEAIRKGRSLRFSPDNLYHLKRPTLAQKDQGWGMPLIYPLLKDAFQMQVLRKAQECLMQEFVVPLRVVFPGPATGGTEQPYGTYNLQNWKSKVESEINAWKRDPAYIPVLPVNIGYQQMGGMGKALLLHQELRSMAEHMLMGCGIPLEFVMGSLSSSPSNQAMRGLANMFLGYNKDRLGLVNWVFDNIASYMRWPKVKVKFARFKMADDLQRAMLYLQLNQAQKVSDRRLLDELDEDVDVETERMDSELKKQLQTQRKLQVASADVQGEALLRTSRYQAKAQVLQLQAQGAGTALGQEAAQQPPGGQAPPPGDAPIPGMPQGATTYSENNSASKAGKLPVALAGMTSGLQAGAPMGVDLRYVAQRAKAALDTLAEEQGDDVRQQELARMATENPQLYKLVVVLEQNATGSQVDPLDPTKAPVPEGGSQRAMGRTIG